MNAKSFAPDAPEEFRRVLKRGGLLVRAVPLEELVRDVLDGKVPDGKTQAAIMRVWAMEKGI